MLHLRPTRLISIALACALSMFATTDVAHAQCDLARAAFLSGNGRGNELVAVNDHVFGAWTTEGLMVLRFDGADQLTRLTSLPLGFVALEIEAGDNVVFVGGEQGIAAVDVSMPAFPRVLDQVSASGFVRELELRNGVLYVVDDHGFQILDVTNPESMVLLYSRAITNARGVAVAGTKCYLATSSAGLIYDVSDPASPVLLTSQAPGAGIVRMTQTRAYVGGFDDLKIVDISTPQSPRVLDQTNAPGLYFESLLVANGMLYTVWSDMCHECGECSNPETQARVQAFDVSSDSLDFLAESITFVNDTPTSLILADGRLLACHRVGVRFLQQQGNLITESARYDDIQPQWSLVAIPGRLVGLATGFTAFGSSWHVLLGTVRLDPGQYPVIQCEVPLTTEYPVARDLVADSATAFVSIAAEDGPSGLDCDPDIYPGDIFIVDLSGTDGPELVASIPPGIFQEQQTVFSLALDPGSRLYAYNDVGIRVIDVTVPHDPAEVSYFAFPPISHTKTDSVVARDGFVYVVRSQIAGEQQSFLEIYDAADSANVQLRSVSAFEGLYWQATLVGPYLALTNGELARLRVFNVSDPDSPTPLCDQALQHAPYRVSASGNFLALADNVQTTVLDLSDPSSPREIASAPGAEQIALGENGDVLYLRDYSGISRFDVLAPSTIDLQATLPLPDGPFDVLTHGSRAYVSDYTAGLRIVDVSNTGTPAEIGFYDTPDRAYQTVVRDETNRTLAYIADGSTGLLVLDVTDPTTPTLMSSFATTDLALALAVDGNFAYLACRFEGLQIVDITDPSAPVLVGSVDTPGSAQSVTIDGQLAYVADGSGGVCVIDVSNRSLPSIFGSYDTPSSARQVLIRGPVAYVPDRTTGLIALDISDPTDPRHISTLPGLGDARSITDFGHLAFIADFNGAVHMIDIADPLDMQLLQSTPTLGTARAITNDAGTIYLADGDAGLTILQARPCWYRPCPADLNDDEVLDFFDVQLFLIAYSASDGLADWNDDGQINFFDVQRYLIDFSAGCVF